MWPHFFLQLSSLSRLTQVTYPSAVDNIFYSYDDGTDGKGRMTGMMDPSSGAYRLPFRKMAMSSQMPSTAAKEKPRMPMTDMP